jgi:hypothetical protein
MDFKPVYRSLSLAQIHVYRLDLKSIKAWILGIQNFSNFSILDKNIRPDLAKMTLYLEKKSTVDRKLL